jgi:VanZ family protein
MLPVQRGMKVFAPLWLLIISVLFFLPGSSLPDSDLFSLPYFDKWVHAGFFAVLLFAWRFYFGGAPRFTWLLLLLAFFYGLLVEVVQHWFIANRSFDLGDVAADVIGAGVGLYFWTRRYIKK